MPIRYCKLALAASSFLFLALVVFNNITDYGSNYAFVEAVLSMNTTFPGNTAMWRAVDSPAMHHIFYWSIIAWEAAAMALIGMGSYRMFTNRGCTAAVFNKAKTWALVGLTVSLLQWYVAFLTVGAEWFLMWQSQSFNGQGAAGRMFTVMGISLIFLSLKDDEIEA